VARLVFWSSALLLAWTQAGYAVARALLARRRPAPVPPPARPAGDLPFVSLIVAAYAEEAVIADKVADALALDWPRERLEVIVAVDGSIDATAERARAAGADLVLELPRGGKVRAQDAAVDRARGALLAFSDANASWSPDALRHLAAPFADPKVGFACGRVAFVNDAGTNQEGIYWRYEMWIRGHESALASVTAGNGAIYAVRRDAYLRSDPRVSHDLALPFQLVKRGWRAVDVPAARATERMVPSVEGEWRRKRRMMARMWGIVARDPRAGGLLDPRGLPPRYLLALASHRWLRYASPALHVVALTAGVAAVAGGRASRMDRGLLAAQLALLTGAGVPGLSGAPASSDRGRARRVARAKPFLLCRYYVLMTASIAAGGLDRLRDGAPDAGWAPAEGTR